MTPFEDFELPAWLKYADTKTLQEKFLYEWKAMKPDIDISEGSFIWDYTRVLAMLGARTIQYHMTEKAKNVFPQFAYGSFLDYHANERGLFRRAAQQAEGLVTFVGTPGTVIEKGTIVLTTAENPADSLSFETTERGTIRDEGSICVAARALKAGRDGNIAAYMINALQSGNPAVSEVFNPTAFMGGKDRETDTELYERIRIFDQRIYASYVGCEQDYKLWALEVPGVGAVQVEGCIDRTGDGGDGIVHVSVTGQGGEAADPALMNEVYNHLMSPGDIENKLVAVNSRLQLETPTVVPLDIKADVIIDKELEVETDTEMIMTEFSKKLVDFLPTTYDKGKVFRREIGSILINVYGVLDYENLTINGEKSNITFEYSEMPTLGEIELGEIE